MDNKSEHGTSRLDELTIIPFIFFIGRLAEFIGCATPFKIERKLNLVST